MNLFNNIRTSNFFIMLRRYDTIFPTIQNEIEDFHNDFFFSISEYSKYFKYYKWKWKLLLPCRNRNFWQTIFHFHLGGNDLALGGNQQKMKEGGRENPFFFSSFLNFLTYNERSRRGKIKKQQWRTTYCNWMWNFLIVVLSVKMLRYDFKFLLCWLLDLRLYFSSNLPIMYFLSTSLFTITHVRLNNAMISGISFTRVGITHNIIWINLFKRESYWVFISNHRLERSTRV